MSASMLAQMLADWLAAPQNGFIGRHWSSGSRKKTQGELSGLKEKKLTKKDIPKLKVQNQLPI